MKNEDLMKNVLDDDEMMSKHPTRKQSTKRMSAYEVAQRTMLVWNIIKGVGIVVLLVGVTYGGYLVLGSVKTMATEAVIDEAKEVASEKYNDVKEKAKDKANGMNFIEAFAAASQKLNDKYDSVLDDQLISKGYDPEAPNYCAGNPDPTELTVCIQYTDTELSMAEYEWVQTAWRGTCEEVHESTISLLALDGRLTYNDKRALIKECDKIKAQQTKEELEEMKRKMIAGGSGD